MTDIDQAKAAADANPQGAKEGEAFAASPVPSGGQTPPSVELYPWQERLVQAIMSGKRLVLLKGRRSGWRTVLAEVERRSNEE